MVGIFKYYRAKVLALRVLSEDLAGKFIVAVVFQMDEQQLVEDDDAADYTTLKRSVISYHLMKPIDELDLVVVDRTYPLTTTWRFEWLRVVPWYLTHVLEQAFS